MGSLGWLSIFLLQILDPWKAMTLSVQQWPPSLRVTQGSKVALDCQVTCSQAWERLRVEWTKDSKSVCMVLLTKVNQSSPKCELHAQLSWWPSGNVTLHLDHVRLNDSSNYVCQAILEIPIWKEAKGNGTKLLVQTGGPLLPETSIPLGLLWVLLVTGGVVVALVALGAGLCVRKRCRQENSGNPFYSNILYRPRDTPHSSESWPAPGKVLDEATEDQRAQRVYSTSFPQPAPCQQHPVPNPAPGPGLTTPSLPPVYLLTQAPIGLYF
ncbi:transmembrane and immunoglobulin domain-containing protein 2 [Nannospalax galili]|uniref:transmembrane and immunoglobulin domain-containing protein 2 n=1 Tax=Nannospalax galili TaxID=1026970 RepID=UPI0004ED3BBF|nr:transmembrane and immunoglobulin domain-containing protein 2 [Nannospalax galili]